MTELAPTFEVVGPVEESEPIVIEVIRLHDEVCNESRSTLQKAFRIGELLTKQKSELQHGEWGQWCITHIPTISERTIQRYMQLWDNKGWLTSTFLKSDTVSDLPLGIREALKAIQDRIIRDTPKDTVTPESVQAIQHNILVLANRLPEYAKVDLLKSSLSKETRQASREMKDVLKKRNGAKNPAVPEPSNRNAISELNQRLQDRFQTEVSIRQEIKGGQIIIRYYNDSDLNRIIELLGVST